MTPHTIADTLTQAEMAALPVARDVNWRHIASLTVAHELVYLLLEGNVVVKGWMSRKFLGGRSTFWTWDPRFSQQTHDTHAGYVRRPGVVEPVAYCAAAAEEVSA